jgi:hypothetical protein
MSFLLTSNGATSQVTVSMCHRAFIMNTNAVTVDFYLYPNFMQQSVPGFGSLGTTQGEYVAFGFADSSYLDIYLTPLYY